jgi:hypothetical protein
MGRPSGFSSFHPSQFMELECDTHHYVLKLGNTRLIVTVKTERGMHKTLTLYDKHGGLASKESGVQLYQKYRCHYNNKQTAGDESIKDSCNIVHIAYA